MSKQLFVLVSDSDIPVGHPLPWSVFLRSGDLLAPAGFIVTDKAAQDRMLQSRPMRAAQASDRKGSLIAAADDFEGVPKSTVDPLEELKHNAEGVVLTFQFPGDYEARTAQVDFYGRVPQQSIIVSAPVVRANNGQSWQHFVGLPIAAQVIFGRTVCAFATSLLHFAPLPSGHLFLRYPSEVVRKPYRQALRVDVRLAASITLPDGTVPGMLTNLSSGGCAISSGFMLGEVGTVVQIAFRLKIGGKAHLLKLNGTIRAVKGKLSQQMQCGVAFDAGMDEATEALLKSFVYEHLAER